MLTSYFRITSLQVINEKLVEMTASLFNSLKEIKIEIESRLHCIDTIAYHCKKVKFLDIGYNAI